jgi:hypothetical protein
MKLFVRHGSAGPLARSTIPACFTGRRLSDSRRSGDLLGLSLLSCFTWNWNSLSTTFGNGEAFDSATGWVVGAADTALETLRSVAVTIKGILTLDPKNAQQTIRHLRLSDLVNQPLFGHQGDFRTGYTLGTYTEKAVEWVAAAGALSKLAAAAPDIYAGIGQFLNNGVRTGALAAPTTGGAMLTLPGVAIAPEVIAGGATAVSGGIVVTTAASAGAFKPIIVNMTSLPEGPAGQIPGYPDANRLHHIFDNPGHKFDSWLTNYSSQRNAFDALQNAIQTIIDQKALTGRFKEIVNLNGEAIVIKGTVIAGLARISAGYSITQNIMINSFSPLEFAIISMFLSGEDSHLAILREQFSNAIVSKRHYTGCGFFTDIEFTASIQRLGNDKRLYLGDISATIAGLRHGADFLLLIEGGAISSLEGVTYDEPWPEQIEGFTLNYLIRKGPNLLCSSVRDIESIRKIFQDG